MTSLSNVQPGDMLLIRQHLTGTFPYLTKARKIVTSGHLQYVECDDDCHYRLLDGTRINSAQWYTVTAHLLSEEEQKSFKSQQTLAERKYNLWREFNTDAKSFFTEMVEAEIAMLEQVILRTHKNKK